MPLANNQKKGGKGRGGVRKRERGRIQGGEFGNHDDSRLLRNHPKPERLEVSNP
jgi:hypothetical protein